MSEIRIPLVDTYPISQLHNYALQAAHEVFRNPEFHIRTRQTENTLRILLESEFSYIDEFGHSDMYRGPHAVIEVPAIKYGHAGIGHVVVSNKLSRFDFDYPFMSTSSLTDEELRQYASAFARHLGLENATTDINENRSHAAPSPATE